jgi:hypothetical protein
MGWISRCFISVAAYSALTAFGADVKSALDAAYSHEFTMSMRYSSVLTQFGEVRPFSNLFRAEERHMAILSQQYQRLGFALPSVPRVALRGFRSVLEACVVSLDNEYESVALYDRLLADTTDPVLNDAFSYLRSASADRHIPALRRCGGWR